ncbi:MAG: tRNA (N(6)-L-threonylcarbamoyladenosine(37)-C(2))-methylthiotransferase MtaB [Eubacteriales bacterium]|nr:tRNA (N(6)-L-threonylcarbamoyladenosine(37)-C(2))-methylthiotransferase MtaB [Eubacteriales bacterium]
MKVVVFNLGCKVNQYESDVIVNVLSKKGYEVTTEFEPADYYILNTCAVTSEAERKSRQAISRAKKCNPNAKIIVLGCASQKNAEQFMDKDGVVTIKGIGGKYSVCDLTDRGNAVEELPTTYEDGTAKSTRTRSYVKVQDGCNNFCSYCIIPYLRGRSRSRSISSVLEEINGLIGVKEVVITGIDLSDYGSDISEDLPSLINALSNVDLRIRLGSLEVNVITDRLLKALKNLKAFCPSFHLSLQTGEDSVLKSMNRHYTTEEYYSKICLIREYFPTASITTDVIVGFPTETEENFNSTLSFVKKVGFSNVHVFPYSAREGTVAYKKYKLLEKSVLKEREKRLVEIKEQDRINYDSKFVGKTVEVLTEDEENGKIVGYTREYVKTYIDKAPKNAIINVKIQGLYLDGLKGE